MGKRVYTDDVVVIAMLYNYYATKGNTRMISKDAILEYERVIDDNLDRMKSNAMYFYTVDNNNLVYYTVKDEKDKEYFVLKPDIEMKKIRQTYLTKIPQDIIEASQYPNALSKINLRIVDSQIVR